MSTDPNNPTPDQPATAAAPRVRELHTFVAYLEDKPGVLARVTALFSRRAYNIDSLTVGPTELPGTSRMTIVMESDAPTARLVEANLYKLVNVLRVENVTHEAKVQHDLSLIKVAVDEEAGPRIAELAVEFGARLVDVSPASVILEITGTEERIESLLHALRPFGIIEMVRTGQVAMTRGPSGIPIDPGFVHARVHTNGEN